MKIGHICIETQSEEQNARFVALVEALDRLAVDQHILVSSSVLARRLSTCPYVTLGPIVRSPVMACCLMPAVDLVHIHGARSGQAGLLLTLTRSIPYVLGEDRDRTSATRPLRQSVVQRARAIVSVDASDPELLLAAYESALNRRSEFPEDSDCR